MSKDEENVSYDVESLFTNIIIKETIDFICDEIYRRKKLKSICQHFIFKKVLQNLQQNVHLVKQENFANR